MKKIVCIGLVFIAIVTILCGCGKSKGSESSSPEDSKPALSQEIKDLSSSKMIPIYVDGIFKHLSYNSATNILYWAEYITHGNYSYTVFLSPNGNPYRFNPESGTIEEIVK